MLDSYVVRTAALDAQHVDVLVAVHVTNKGDEKAQTTVSGWIGVMVPVVVSAERASVAGEPALAGIPTPTQTARTERLDIDRDITDATRADAAAFVRAWAAGDATALSAPGAEIDSPLQDLRTQLSTTGASELARAQSAKRKPQSHGRSAPQKSRATTG